MTTTLITTAKIYQVTNNLPYHPFQESHYSVYSVEENGVEEFSYVMHCFNPTSFGSVTDDESFIEVQPDENGHYSFCIQGSEQEVKLRLSGLSKFGEPVFECVSSADFNRFIDMILAECVEHYADDGDEVLVLHDRFRVMEEWISTAGAFVSLYGGDTRTQKRLIDHTIKRLGVFIDKQSDHLDESEIRLIKGFIREQKRELQRI